MIMSKDFDKKLIKLLETDRRWTDQNGKLIKRAVIDRAWRTDHRLVRLLLSDPEVKAKFFDKIAGVLVFNAKTLIDYISNKKFLGDSWTRFRNKIGLNIDGKFLRERGEVSLVWPYKDCVLEGGQTKEEETRKEIFFNEILAHDEINRLFDPKVLTGWKRHTAKGAESVSALKRDKSGTIRENLIIKGNNLLALHTLKQQFQGKVKLIYIDPPYNTGGDSFKYNDNFNHSSWLTFMKNRLEAAKDLLRKDGVIFVQCDDSEQAYLKVLMDEVFGKENFRENISVKIGSESGVNAINVLRGERLFKVKEHIIYYAKNSSAHKFNPLYVKAMSFNESYRLEVKKQEGKYIVEDIYKKILKEKFKRESVRGLSKEKKQILHSLFKEYSISNSGNMYALKSDIQKSGDKFKKFAFQNKNKNIVEEYKTSDERTILVYKGGMLSPLSNRIVKENGNKFYGTLVSDFWWDIGATPSSEGGVDLKSGKKPEKMLRRIIEIATQQGDIVLDYHLGSGTTAAVAHKTGRQYIGVEQLDYGNNDSVVRLNNVIKGDPSGISKSVGWKGGGDFLSCELMKYNEAFMERIQGAKSSKELIALWKDIAENSFLNYYVNPEVPEEALNDFIKIGEEEGFASGNQSLPQKSELQNRPASQKHSAEGGADKNISGGQKAGGGQGEPEEWKNQKYIEKTFGAVLREGKTGLERQKRLLAALLDKNQLYVCLSEIDDKDFKVSKEDKRLNKLFFNTDK